LGSFSLDLVRSEYLQKIYLIKSVLPARTYLGLRSEEEEIALLHLLQFVEEHYPSMLRSFHRNESWTPQTRLICGNHALTQLQMTSSTPSESILGLFDKCITPMGKRAIKERLLSPYSDATEIRSRLKEIQEYMGWSDEKIRQLERQLRFMFDLPRLHRRLLCGVITAAEIAGLFQTYHAMQLIMVEITANTSLSVPYTLEQWSNYLQIFRTHFSEEKAQQSSADLTAFHGQTYPDIERKERDIGMVHDGFRQLRQEMASKGGITEDAIRMEEREKEPFGFKASTIILQQLKKNVKQLPEGTKFTELKSGGWIDCTRLQQLNTKLQKDREVLAHLVRDHLLDACQAISEAGSTIWSFMEHWICHVDGTQCIGRVSKEKGFSCPTIEDPEEGSCV
jgi:DNA mismatch repair protein MutS